MGDISSEVCRYVNRAWDGGSKMVLNVRCGNLIDGKCIVFWIPLTTEVLISCISNCLLGSWLSDEKPMENVAEYNK
jgi:hypothetical protein